MLNASVITPRFIFSSKGLSVEKDGL